MLLLIGAMIVLAVWLMFTVASQAPGVTPELFQKSTLFPFVFGYMRILGISYKAATAISIVPSIGTALAYFFIIAKQVTAMASSGLLPPVLKTRFGPNDTPLYAYLLVSGCALAANFFARFVNIYSTSTRTATIAGCFVYLSMFYCYYVFTHRYGHMDRAFRNPLGWVSAVIGSVIFLGILVILLAFHLEYRVVTIFYFAYIALMVLFYYVYVESHQHFSSSEQKVFFKAYIINRKTAVLNVLIVLSLFSLVDSAEAEEEDFHPAPAA
jgi:amino acid transporter